MKADISWLKTELLTLSESVLGINQLINYWILAVILANYSSSVTSFRQGILMIFSVAHISIQNYIVYVDSY